MVSLTGEPQLSQDDAAIEAMLANLGTTMSDGTFVLDGEPVYEFAPPKALTPPPAEASVPATLRDAVQFLNDCRNKPADAAQTLLLKRRKRHDGQMLEFVFEGELAHMKTKEGAAGCDDAVAALKRATPRAVARLLCRALRRLRPRLRAQAHRQDHRRTRNRPQQWSATWHSAADDMARQVQRSARRHDGALCRRRQLGSIASCHHEARVGKVRRYCMGRGWSRSLSCRRSCREFCRQITLSIESTRALQSCRWSSSSPSSISSS
jgi:hypothetical protein